MVSLKILSKIITLSSLFVAHAIANDLYEFAGSIELLDSAECIDCLENQDKWSSGSMSNSREIDINYLRTQVEDELEMKSVIESFDHSVRQNGLAVTLQTYQLDRPENYEISNKILGNYMRLEALRVDGDKFEDSKRVLLEKNLAPVELASLEMLKEIRSKNANDNVAFIEAVKTNFSNDKEFESAIYKDSIMLVDDFSERRKFILNMAEIGTDQNAIGNIIHEYIIMESLTGESDEELIKQLGRSYNFETILDSDNIMCKMINDVDSSYADSVDLGKVRQKKAQKMLDRLFEIGANHQSKCQDGSTILEHMQEKGYSLDNLPVAQKEKPCVTFSGDASVTDLCDMSRVVYDIVKRMSDNELLNEKNQPKDITGVYMASEEGCNYSLFDRFYVDENGVFRRSMKVKLAHAQVKEPVLIEGNEKETLVQSLRELVKPSGNR